MEPKVAANMPIAVASSSSSTSRECPSGARMSCQMPSCTAVPLKRDVRASVARSSSGNRRRKTTATVTRKTAGASSSSGS